MGGGTKSLREEFIWLVKWREVKGWGGGGGVSAKYVVLKRGKKKKK
jgi:hypothetical protein